MDHQAGPDETGPGGDSSAWDSLADGPGASATAGIGAAEAGDQPADHEPAPDLAAAQASAPETGEPRVDAALRLLDRLPELPVSDHAAVFEQVHAELTGVLGELDPESAATGG